MLRIRLQRIGAKKKPVYRIVVAEARTPRDTAAHEIIGQYNPRTEPTTVVIDEPKAREWLARGAQPSERVAGLLRIKGIKATGS